MADAEVALGGGDVTAGVVRVGNTVRRPVGAHSPVVHRVLRHLEEAGFDGAPRFLGLDHQGREILSFIEGDVAARPWPAWVGDESRGLSVARLLRRLDDCLEELGLPEDLALDSVAAVPGITPTFLGHRDVTPENTVFRDGQAYALIDFDLVRPSSRVDEVVNLLLWWGGWLAPEDRSPVFAGVDPAVRGRALVDAYGLSDDERLHVVPVAMATAELSWDTMRQRALTLGGGWARMWEEGVGDRIRRRQRWLEQSSDVLGSALI
ncbi:MAG: phosphotransferase [Marmoricola sp.]